MSYNFVQIEIPEEPTTTGSSFGLVFNGVEVESAIPGFVTLSVTGRGMLPREVALHAVSGLDGRVFSHSSMPERTIIVKYLLAAGTDTELRERFSKLNKMLHQKEEKPISFLDEPGFSFYGSLASINEPEEVSNEIIGELVFVCSSPFKYSNNENISGGVIPADPLAVGATAEFQFTVTAAAESVTFSNSLGDSFQIAPVIPAVYKLKFSKKWDVYQNGIRKMTLLGLTEPLEAFRVLPGVTYSVSTGAAVTGVYKVVRL